MTTETTQRMIEGVLRNFNYESDWQLNEIVTALSAKLGARQDEMMWRAVERAFLLVSAQHPEFQYDPIYIESICDSAKEQK